MMEKRKGRAGAEHAEDGTDSDNSPDRRRHSASGGAAGPLEAPKLVLEYLRVLIWPAVALSFLIGFSSQLRDLIQRVSKVGAGGVSAEFSTGHATTPAGVPDVWFDIRETSLRRGDCMNRAQTALQKSGFQQITRGEVTYGYANQFVGAVWCGWRDGLVLITVAGPKKGLPEKHSELANSFSG